MAQPSESTTRLSRRRFLKTTATGVGLAAAEWAMQTGATAGTADAQDGFSFGLVTDVHYADAPPRGSRHYRDSLAKLCWAIETFNRRRVPLAIELGDLIDSGPTKADELDYLRAIDRLYQGFQGQRHYVLGNHCLAAMSKEEFLATCKARVTRSFYSFDPGRFHFVVLDANFRQDGTSYAAGNFSWTDTWIHTPQQDWLADDLEKARSRKTFVFVHQNLDDENDAHGVKNAAEVRRILEAAGNVVAVFQGHKHAGGYAKINGIHYCTLKALVEGPAPENNAYAIVHVDRSGRLRLEGFGRQPDGILT